MRDIASVLNFGIRDILALYEGIGSMYFAYSRKGFKVLE